MKKIFVVIIVNIILVISIFIILEIIVRLFYPQINLAGTSIKLLKDRVYYSSPGLTPNSSGISYGKLKTVDSLGFWEFNNSKNLNKKNNWLLLGDSAAMGIGVENDSTFAGIIDSQLDSIKIFNPSLIGYSSNDYLNIVKKIIDETDNKLGIKKILIFWCLNDIYDNYPTKDTPDMRSKGALGVLINSLSTNLKTWHLLKELFSDRQKDYFDYDKQFYTQSDTNLTQSVKDIIQCSSIGLRHGIDTKLILLPYEYQIRYIDNENLHIPQKLMKEKLLNSGIDVIDILQLISNKQLDSKSLFLFGDGIHFSEKGHRFLTNLFMKNRILQTN